MDRFRQAKWRMVGAFRLHAVYFKDRKKKALTIINEMTSNKPKGGYFMTEEEIAREAEAESKKPFEQLKQDIIREAITLPEKPAGEKENLDIIKHLIKRLALHQISLEAKAKKANILLIVLSVIMAIGSLFSILSFCYRP